LPLLNIKGDVRDVLGCEKHFMLFYQGCGSGSASVSLSRFFKTEPLKKVKIEKEFNYAHQKMLFRPLRRTGEA
jgi:hypothetical protein